MEYSKEFKALLNDSNWNQLEPYQKYIGVGNPNAKILIVGKECALDTVNQFFEYDETVLQNFDDWCANVNKGIGFEDIKDWLGNNKDIYPNYNPLYPFYKQLFIQRKVFKKDNEVIKIIGDGGTSTTWYNYQKIINLFRERHINEYELRPNYEYVDFFKDCFITELNDLCRPNNGRLSKTERGATREHIGSRYDLICNTPYFQHQFSTVILACRPYSKELDTRRMFGNAKIIEYKDGVLIPQLSVNITNKLIEYIAGEII